MVSERQPILEQRLRDACALGTPVDLTDEDDRQVPANLIVELLTAPLAAGEIRRAVRLTAAEIVGRFDLEAATLLCPISLSRCDLRETLRLANADGFAIYINDCTLKSLDAAQLRTRGDVDLSRTTVDGEISLRGGHVGGCLVLTGATLTNPSGTTLNANGLRVDQDVFCTGNFTSTGMIEMVGAQIGGELNLRTATLDAASDPETAKTAMNADHIRIGKSLFGDTRFEASGEIRLGGASVAGQMLLAGAKIFNPKGRSLYADGLRVEYDLFWTSGQSDGEIWLSGARVGGQLVLRDTRLTNPSGAALTAEGLDVAAAMYCDDDFAAIGEIALASARIGGELCFSGATLRGPATGSDDAVGYALSAAGLEVKQDLVCGSPFEATGAIVLIGAHIGGAFNLNGAKLRNPRGMALDAELLQARDMKCSDFQASGTVRLAAAHIALLLDLRGATLTSDPDRPALDAVRLQVDHDMYCSGITASGEIKLSRCRVAGRLDFTRATLGSSTNVDLEEAMVGTLVLGFEEPPAGVMNLAAAQFERLVVPRHEDATAVRCRLRGCRYEALEPGSEEEEPERRLHWLAAGPDRYSPQPYEQLAEVYRRSGDDEAARRVLIAKQRRRGQEAVTGPARGWSWFLGVTVGYGHRLWFAGIWLIALALVGSLLFGLVFEAGTSAAADLTPAKSLDEVPPFQPILYAIDVLLPVISLGQDTAWNTHGVAQWSAAAGTFLGWLLTTALVAGLIIRRP